jgi:hypothetical protein
LVLHALPEDRNDGAHMTSSSKRKGDKGELEVQGILREELGLPARRMLGAGRKDDVGDITGVPDTVIQVTTRADLARAVREKLPEVEEQRQRAGAKYSAVFARRRGGAWVVVMTPEMWCSLIRETM